MNSKKAAVLLLIEEEAVTQSILLLPKAAVHGIIKDCVSMLRCPKVTIEGGTLRFHMINKVCCEQGEQGELRYC